MTDILANCPFCGAKDRRFTGAKGQILWPLYKEAKGPGYGGYWVVECDGCCAEGPPKATEAEAITAWNTRAPSPDMAEAVEIIAQAHCDLHHPVAPDSRLRRIARIEAFLARVGAA